MIEKCCNRGTQMIFLPENFAYQSPFSRNKGYRPWHENIETGEWFLKYRKLANKNRVWLSLGAFPETCEKNPENFYNSHFIIDDNGEIRGHYRELHQLMLSETEDAIEKVE